MHTNTLTNMRPLATLVSTNVVLHISYQWYKQYKQYKQRG